MQLYHYLSLIPESIVVSMLDPMEFGSYYALGRFGRARGQAIFFEIDPEMAAEAIDMEDSRKRCVPHSDGSPRKSSYLQIYRALEQVPAKALRRLHLTTDDGRTLSLEPGTYEPDPEDGLHLYQELCPVTPRVASRLDPLAFSQLLTRPDQPIHLPRVVFAEMRLDALATNPDSTEVDNLPYVNIQHLRDCLNELRGPNAKPTKTVLRQIKQDVLYRTIRNGFFLADAETFLYYPMPSRQSLEAEYYEWWRSALTSFGV